jgi:hypothetical protein
VLCSLIVCALSMFVFSLLFCFLEGVFIGAEDVKYGDVFLWFVGVPCV